jgi:hypothetical protein
MPDASAPFVWVMKRLLFAMLNIVAAAALAADVPPVKLGERAEKLLSEALPVCSEAVKISRADLQHKLPANLTGTVVRIESERQACQGQWVGVVSEEGGLYVGVPWFLDGVSGTIEEKLKTFTWKNMQENFSPVVDRQKTRDGLYKVTLLETTEHGKVPFQGEVDPAGTVVFLGPFHPLLADVRASRLKVFEPFIAQSPSTGAAKPDVTVIEFSDFECPSCQRAATYMKPILTKYGDKVRYVRYDLPLLNMHPWAFAAAVAGRAVHRQKPELFWDFKEQVYANQDKLTAFTIDDFVRGFAQDHDLDLKKFDADIASPELRKSLLDGVGTAFSNDIRATPTYFVNGVVVDPGIEGKGLETYVTGLLKK